MKLFARERYAAPARAAGGKVFFWRSPGLTARGMLAAVFLLSFVAFEWVSFIHAYKGLPITPWNPGLGAVFALIVSAGLLGGLVLFAGAVLAEVLVLHSDLEWPLVTAIGMLTAASYTFVGLATRERLRLDVGLTHLRDVLLLLAAGLSGAFITAILLTGLLIVSGHLDLREVPDAAVPLLIGDIIGIAVMTPLVLRFAFRPHALTTARLMALAPEALLYAAVVMAGLWLIIGNLEAGGSKFFYLLFLPVVAAALRHGLDGACLGLAVMQLGLVGLLHLYGLDARVFTEFQTLMLVLTATGLIVGVVVSERENADRRVREAERRLKEKEAEAARAARFHLVSGMASALAHEINQPMTAARALARSVQHLLRAPEGDRVRAEANLEAMVAQIDHAGDIVRRMREFLRRGRPHVSTLDVRTLLEDALSLLRAEATANRIRVELEVAEALPALHGDRIQLQQVVLNLARNAIEAIAGARQKDGRVRVSAGRLEAPDRIEIAIADNGPGISAELAPRLFEPLTTSKEEGFGLGLPICASIIETHGGRIWLHSRAPGATEFRFWLPIDHQGIDHQGKA